jgi:LPS-assembly lipoprotein
MSWCSRAVALSLALALGGCGFQLRGQATYSFSSIYVNAPSAPPFAMELRRALENTGSARLAPNPESAEVILDVPKVADEKTVLSLSSGGRVAEYALAKRVEFRLRDRNGDSWLPSDEFIVRRTYTYDDSERLARELQEQRLLREMQSDAVQQIVRRLQAAKKPA